MTSVCFDSICTLMLDNLSVQTINWDDEKRLGSTKGWGLSKRWNDKNKKHKGLPFFVSDQT